MNTKNLKTDRDKLLTIYQKLVIESALLSIKNEKLEKFIDSKFFENLSEDIKESNHKQYSSQQKLIRSLFSKISAFVDEHNITEAEMDFQTKGEQIIGRFNASGKSEVDEIKLEAITLINSIDAVAKDQRRASIAYTEIEKGVMMAIKSLF